MARTIQKKIKFSKGQIVPELVERTDLELYDSSAQKMENIISTVYGGVKSRRGTKYIDFLTSSQNETGTATVYIGGNASDLQSLTPYQTTNIGTNRNVWQIQYTGAGDRVINVKDIRIDDKLILVSQPTVGTYTFNQYVDHEVYLIMTSGGLSFNMGKTSCSGSGIECYAVLTQGNYSYNVGDVGNDTTTFSGDDISIQCLNNKSNYEHKRGDVVYTLPQDSTVLRKTNNENTSLSFIDNTLTGYGAGKTEKTPAVSGYVKVAFGYVEAVFEQSDDGSTWETITTSNITTDNKTISFTASKEYVRMRINENASYNFTGTMTIGVVDTNNASSYQTPDMKFKMLKYIYDNDDKYLLVLTDEVISIYKDDSLIERVSAIGLSEDYFDTLKYTYKDDTIIFTHEDMAPKILKNTPTGWVFSDLSINNIPYSLFGPETTTTKTVPIKPSSTEGSVKLTADSSVFDSGYVGQYIDGNGGRVRITEYISGTVVNGVTVIPFYTDDKINSWTYISGYEAVWSVSRGYPRTCLFAQQRLWFGGSKGKPTSLWASRVGDYFNFKNSGNYENDAIDIELTVNDAIVNIIENRGIHIFTGGQEISIPEGSYTPDKISVVINTRNGSKNNLTPVVFGGIVAFIEKNGHSLLSYLYNDSVSAYETQNISMFSNLISAPITMDAEVNSMRDRGDYLYIVLENGKMLVGCYDLSNDVKSIAQFITDGPIKDVCCLGEETYIAVVRNDLVQIEKVVDARTDNTIRQMVVGNTITGLSSYIGKSVYVYDEKHYVEKHDVLEDELTLDSAYTGNLYIGLPYQYELESNPISINNQTYSIKKRITKATLVCEDTEQIRFNEQKKDFERVYDFYNCTKYDEDVRFTISGEFYPIHILSVFLNINYEG